MSAVFETSIPSFPMRRGKVRDIYDLGHELLIIATDRISAFDVVMPTPVPGKGKLLTKVSTFWFRFLQPFVEHHLLEVIENTAPIGMEEYLPILSGRAIRCRKANVIPIECVARGYLAGSGWQEYQATGSVCGVELPSGLKNGDALPQPIFTPATKAEVGHDINITFEQSCDIAGHTRMVELRDKTLGIYLRASQHARERGIIIADTKLEWGEIDGKLILIDEVLTPDSSRFWPLDRYVPGQEQVSFDKQYLRNYLLELVTRSEWNKTPPGPVLPTDVIAETQRKYEQAVDMLLGEPTPHGNQ